MCPVQAVAGSASAVWCRRQLVVMVPSTSYTRCAPIRDAPRALTIALKAYRTEWCDPPLPSTSTSYERASIAKCTPSSPCTLPCRLWASQQKDTPPAMRELCLPVLLQDEGRDGEQTMPISTPHLLDHHLHSILPLLLDTRANNLPQQHV
ncbi:hypothetical protein DDE82_007854 [Stemphylium lycopersici]|nr:hypothetical protein DDE82_007854 [Stemphylium lycopersici]